LAEVAGLNLDGAKELAVGGIDEGIGQLFQQRGGLGLEL